MFLGFSWNSPKLYLHYLCVLNKIGWNISLTCNLHLYWRIRFLLKRRDESIAQCVPYTGVPLEKTVEHKSQFCFWSGPHHSLIYVLPPTGWEVEVWLKVGCICRCCDWLASCPRSLSLTGSQTLQYLTGPEVSPGVDTLLRIQGQHGLLLSRQMPRHTIYM